MGLIELTISKRLQRNLERGGVVKRLKKIGEILGFHAMVEETTAERVHRFDCVLRMLPNMCC